MSMASILHLQCLVHEWNLTPRSLIATACLCLLSTTVVLCTRALSSRKAQPKPPKTAHEPPTAPFWLPYFGHLFSFLRNPNQTFAKWKRRYPKTPFTLLMMDTKFHIFSSASTASHIFSHSRDFIFEPVVASMMENGLNLPHADRPFFQIPLKPAHLLSDRELASRKFLTNNHSIYLKYLTSNLLIDVMQVYMDNFHHVLTELLDVTSPNWTTVNYHELVRKTIFEASALTFFGTRLRTLWPNMWEDWKAWNDVTFTGVRSNASFYLRPKALAARRRMLRAFDKWVDTSLEDDWPEEHGLWNAKWGIKMNWDRERLARETGFSLRGRSCSQASFLFVIVTNSAPMATWFTMCVLRSPGGLKRYRHEIEPLVLPSDGGAEHELKFDLAALRQNQYVRGVWQEALRTGSASAAARVVVKESEIEGYMVRPGSVLMLPVQLLHFNPEVFVDPEKIRPERWIDDEKGSRKEQLQKQNTNLRPFGGGTGLCSGRLVAEQEIVSVVSTLLLLFDFEMVTKLEDFELDPRSIGIMGPKKDPIVRLKRRKIKD